MPVCFRLGWYRVYFWMGDDIEPIHVHIGRRRPGGNATKVWLLRDGSVKVAHNKSRIPDRELNKLLIAIQLHWQVIVNQWCVCFRSSPWFYDG